MGRCNFSGTATTPPQIIPYKNSFKADFIVPTETQWVSRHTTQDIKTQDKKFSSSVPSVKFDGNIKKGQSVHVRSAPIVVKNSSLGDLGALAVQNSSSSPSTIQDDQSSILPAFIPTGYLADAKLRINAYRELAEANTPKSITSLEKNWIDRHGRLPDAVQNLFTIARIKAEAASNNVTSVELSNQRLILHRNGSPILLDGSRFPRLTKSKPAEKLEEALEMLQNF